ncbi:hypothetical protein GCU60_18940 [Blastococcus saxobsidens]|uniref:Uncharacterized protein n=1 Tax=Blastococcus saxobsidens TaxID=138336 RepID=A0A6L9W8L5_9ACTN|nr:hypothetical protein [Blastococcus saxobsidens]NEK87820.1 hypothetical protein [Blastococcus saxobsidens]
MDPAARVDPIAQAIDGATGDWSMSGDAMRWSPELAERAPTVGELGGLDSGSGAGGALGLDMTGVRRLVSDALTSLGAVAADVAAELRSRTVGSPSEPPEDSRDE